VRVVGGHADLSDVRFENLGFWSGRTGGVSLTGTELPDADAEGVLPNPIINGQEIIPSGQQLETLALDGDISGYGTVSAFVRNVSFTGNAFGLFVSSADGVMVQNSTVLGSLVDGLVFHRNVRNSEIQSTESSANAGDGIVVTRATTGNVLTRVTASGNSRNGITLEGGPLADGPSATGTPIGVYGDNQVTDSVASDNGRYGIHVDGGAGIRVDGNIFAGNEMGVVVSEAATAVTIANNEVLSSSRQGIALRESGTDLVVEDNVVRGGEIGIYARNAGGTFERNEVGEVTSHAITLVGETGASVIAGNTVAGVGPSAIDIARTSDVAVSENDADSWTSTKPLDVVIRNFLQPLTVLWLTLGLLVVVSAVSGVKRRGHRHPSPLRESRPDEHVHEGVSCRGMPSRLSARRSWSRSHDGSRPPASARLRHQRLRARCRARARDVGDSSPRRRVGLMRGRRPRRRRFRARARARLPKRARPHPRRRMRSQARCPGSTPPAMTHRSRSTTRRDSPTGSPRPRPVTRSSSRPAATRAASWPRRLGRRMPRSPCAGHSRR
jgi:hypothetical protein